jgi:hypothetical protein
MVIHFWFYALDANNETVLPSLSIQHWIKLAENQESTIDTE